jgi:type II secretory pathway pseudopilin PulG
MIARVRQLAADERGMTLVEMLMVCILSVIVLGATLSAVETFERNARTNERVNEAQDNARNSLDRMARDLRNLASPIKESPDAVDRAAPQDVVFQSEGNTIAGGANARNTERVRYCLDAQGNLWRQIQTWTTATPPAASADLTCPGKTLTQPGGVWLKSSVVASSIVNGNARPVFTYNATTLKDITEVSATLWIDVNPATVKPPETTLQTSVYLRNQNRKPIAAFSADVVNGSVLLNASESTDPEEKSMTYTWFFDGATTSGGSGILLTKALSPGNHTVKLVVNDGVLPDDETKTICVPNAATGVTC